MTTPTFRYVEEYIEFIAGHRDITGRHLGLFDTVPSPISLARYDIQIVESMAEQTIVSNRAYTDKQAELAKRIVSKYKKQLSQLAKPVYLPEQLDQFRLGIRQIDRTKSIRLNQNRLEIRFPFDTKLIEAVKTQAKDGNGAVAFDHDLKIWKMALTESNLNWAVAVGEAHEFEISTEVRGLYEKMLVVEQQDYRIELVQAVPGFEITNAPESLVNYINEHLGGFGADNFLILADNSAVLGYEISKPLIEQLKNNYRQFYFAIKNRKLKRNKNTTTLEHLVEYARAVNRLPVYVYNTGMPYSDTDEIKYLNRTKDVDVSPKLIVSMTELMIGSKKQSWLNNAEKIFYLT